MDFKILKAEKILYGEELEVLKNYAIVIEAEKITEIIPQENLKEFDISSAEIIDLKDLTVMPGLIDCHSHLNIDANIPDHLELLSWSNECELTLISLKGIKEDLLSGVTTLRCLGDKFYTDITLKNKISNNEVTGPDILASGIGIKGGHGSGYIGYPHWGVEEVRRTVRENLKKRADTLKLFITPGQPPLNGDFIPSYLSLEEIKVAVSEGKKQNISVAAHCIGGEGLRNCIEGGVKVIEHMYAAKDADIELLKNSDCWVDLTPGIFMDPSREEFLAKENVAAIRASRDYVVECMKKIIDAKIPFTLGTDAYHGKLYREAEFALQLGAGVKDTLKAVTSNAAKVCQREESMGNINRGYLANIIAVNGNPYEDISALSRVKFVMKRGKIYKNTL